MKQMVLGEGRGRGDEVRGGRHSKKRTIKFKIMQMYQNNKQINY